ncbi:MAG: methyltransferase [Burkholderiales bacterium]|nr:methyltransferase [Bacteroidia bacterium]
MQTFAKPYVLWYLKKERTDTVRDFKLIIKPTVFHPKFFFSSIFLFDFISTLNLAGKHFLEIGCGSGLISLLAHQKKAIVTACDINDAAVDCAKLNFEKNFAMEITNVSVLKSDLFDAIPDSKFDIIVINPPYFFEDVKTDDQLAWNCGKNGEYFIKLFSGLQHFIHAKSKVYMILADNCEIDKIKQIAKSNLLEFHLIVQKKIKWENNFIFKIDPI